MDVACAILLYCERSLNEQESPKSNTLDQVDITHNYITTPRFDAVDQVEWFDENA
jgi:hypothetical protein